MNASRFALSFLLALPFISQLPAIAAPLETDRPDLTETSQVVGARAYQLEQGGQALTGLGGPVFVLPSLHRFGLSDRLELRLETPIVELAGGQARFTDVALGGKWRVLDGGEPGGAPSLSLLAHLGVDAQGGLTPIAKLLSDTALPLGFDFSLNAGASYGGGQADWDMAVALGHDLTEALSAYVEGSRAEPMGASGPGYGVDAGLRYLLNDDTQLDVGVYKGLSAGAPDWYGTLGLSVRWGR